MPKVVPFDIGKSFAHISIVGTVPLVFVVNPNVPARDLKELIALAKNQPGKLSFASAGNGSPQHLATEMFQHQAQVEVMHVPYKGSGPAISDLLGGQVTAMIDTVPAAQAQTKADKLRALATTTAQRVPSLPDTPTAAEAGLPDFQVSSMLGLAAPAGTPPDVIKKINTALKEILPRFRSGPHRHHRRLAVGRAGRSAGNRLPADCPPGPGHAASERARHTPAAGPGAPQIPAVEPRGTGLPGPAGRTLWRAGKPRRWVRPGETWVTAPVPKPGHQ